LNLVEKIIDEHQLNKFCQDILPELSKYHLVLLHGQMGAGKTSFVRALGQVLDFADEAGSPTFSIINEYHIPKNQWNITRIYHMDLYRLKSIQEALDIGIMDYLDGPALTIIEWPELIEDLIRKETYLDIHIEVLENQQRRFILTV
jgi:tRNA threonylcarbamoyladenosine biosynthesis protein TsaE